MILRAGQDQLEVPLRSNRAIDKFEKARPTGPAVKFHLGIEKGLLATGAHIFPGSLLIVQRTGPGPFGALLAKYAILLVAQQPSPFIITAHHDVSVGHGLITVTG
jgi:hypothetical protein